MLKTELMEVAAPLAERLGLDRIALAPWPTTWATTARHRGGGVARRGLAAGRGRLGKAEVRELLARARPRTWNKPQLACLSSRFPYWHAHHAGAAAGSMRSRRAARARLRPAAGPLPRQHRPASSGRRRAGARVQPDVRRAILELGAELGFTYVTVDLRGFRTGSLNEAAPAPLVSIRKLG